MADEADDLDYSESNVGLAQAQGVRKNISLKLKGKGRGRGRRGGGKARRGSSAKKVSGAAEDETEGAVVEEASEENTTEKQVVEDSNLEDVISKLETSAFSPMDRTFSEPLHQNKKLRWDHKVNLIGEKVIDPLIHCCEKCSLPILNYGRMIPCKHVFCYDCAKKSDKMCPKCDEKIMRTEPSALGTVFMCTFGGTRHSPGACGRTYLSQRDLQAHINHRHMKPSSTAALPATASTGHVPLSRDPRDPRCHLQVDVSSHQGGGALIVGHVQHPAQQQDHREPVVDHSRSGGASIPMGSPAGQSRQYPPHSPASYPSTIPVSSARPNLITVPIQDDPAGVVSHLHSQAHVPYAPPPAAATTSHPMPALQQHPGSAYVQHAYPHATPSSAYSQAPPITTITFSQPPPLVHHQPPLHQPGSSAAGPMYSTTPLPPMHHQPPSTYTPPRVPVPRQPMHPLPPQRFHEEGTTASYMPPQWVGGSVPPPPSRASLAPRPAPPPSATNPILQPRGPTDNTYRQPYYQ